MEKPLWENSKLRIWKIEGVVSGMSIGFTEPEGVDYYLRVGRNKIRRGTMLGNPSFLQTHDTFYGAAHYKTVDIKTKEGSSLSVSNVTAVKKFQKFISKGNRCTLYMLSPKNDSAGNTIIFAVKAGNEQVHDIDGLCSMTDILQAGIKRQILMIAVPVVISITLFSAIPFFSFGNSFLPFFIFFLLFVAVICAAGVFLLGVIIRNSGFPSKAIFEEILRTEGMHLPS
ncbi:MAG: hypothetical protein JW957_08885 [Candidatus Omnitrophica bacterium]|nr:hypothetical protein [Candidatus Omnitrophota bacterium]